MRLAEIKDGVVVNVIEADPDNPPEWATDWPEAGQAGPGWAYDGKAFAPPPDPEPETLPDPDPTPAQLQAAIEAVAKAAGLSDSALVTAMESAGISRRVEQVQPVEPGPVIGGRE